MMIINNCILLPLARQLCKVYLSFINKQYLLRPILLAICSFNHEATKWLTRKLSFLRDHPTNIKNSFRFIDNIKNKCFQNKIMDPFQVKSLFTVIHVLFTKALIIYCYYNTILSLGISILCSMG